LLRIGIIVENEFVPAWVNEVIIGITKLTNVECTVAIQYSSGSFENLFFKTFDKLNSTLLSGKPNLTKKNRLALAGAIPIIKGKSKENRLSQEECEIIRNTDLLLNFTFALPEESIAQLPRLGVWGLFDSKNHLPLNHFTGFNEWFDQQPVTAIFVGQTKKNFALSRLADGLIKTEYLSYSRNQTAIYAKAIDLVLRLVERLSNTTELTVTDFIREPVIKKTEIKISLWIFMVACWRLLYRVAEKSLDTIFFIRQWVLFFSFEPLTFPKLDFKKFKELVPAKDRIWADPFVISQDDKHYIFFEELLVKTNKGHISCMMLSAEGETQESKIIIDRPYHLSYPYLLKQNNIWYMVPESADNKTVDLFECAEFPFKWEFRQSLLRNVQAYDSSVHFYKNKFWLFCTIKKTEGASTDDDLYIFFSEEFPTSNWVPHPLNPVLSDPSVARPAGKIFSYKDELYRPSQIGVPRYGYGLSLNKITELSESSYKEESVSKAVPDWRNDLLSVHTLNFTDQVTIIDGQLKRFKF
jgi:hypothetical protein